MFSKFSVKKPYTVLVGVILVLVLGYVSFTKMSADLLPDINLPYVVIMTTYVGASPESVEMTVTSPVESAMATVSNIEGIQSMSAENYSVVILEFSQTTNMDSTSLEIREKLDQLKSYWSDKVGNPVIMKLNPNMLPIMIAAVGVEGMDEYEISAFTQDKIVPEIESIEGVASVNANGLVEESLNVVIYEDKLEKVNKRVEKEIEKTLSGGYKTISDNLKAIEDQKKQVEDAAAAGFMKKPEAEMTLAQLEEAGNQLTASRDELDKTKEDILEGIDVTKILDEEMVKGILTAQNFSMPAGYIQEGEDQYLVRVGNKPEDVEDLKKLPILSLPVGDGVWVTVGDVADVFLTNNLDEVYTNVNGKNGVVLSLQKQTGYSTGDVSKKINEKFSELEERYENLQMVNLMDQGVYIDLVMSTIFENVLIGGLLAIIILIFFLRDIRPTLIIAISIPVSLITAVVCMYFSGVTLNIISLSGLALGVGMLVDNSIVVIENIYRLRGEGVDRVTAAIEGAKEVAGAIFASTLTTVCVFLPIVFTEGITRQLFVDMGLTIAFSLMASLVVALTVVPALAAGTLRKVKIKKAKENKGFYYHYSNFLRVCLKIKPLIILIAIALLVLSAYAAATRGTKYFPDMESPQITATVRLSEDSELTQVRDAADELVEKIRTIDDVVDAGAMSSSTTLSLFGASRDDSKVTSATIYITTEEKRELTGNELAAKIKDMAKDIDGITVSVETSTMDMSALGGSGISVEIKGRNIDRLYELADKAGKILADTEGVAEVNSDVDDSEPELRVVVDKRKAIENKLTVAQIFSAVSDALSDPSVATMLSTDTADINVYVDDDSKMEVTRENIKEIKIKTTDKEGNDKYIRLNELARFEEAKSLSTINRKDQSRYVTVSATLKDGYNIGLVSADAEKNMEALSIPEGYSLEFAGENEMIMEALKQLLLMLVLAVIFIYLIMVAQFQSLSSPFIIMFTIPLAFTGGLAALYFTNNEISIIAMIGFVMLSGIIVNNGIVLVDYINQLRERGVAKKDAIVEAGATRLRPVLMTALTTILALFTMAFSTKMGSDMSRPLAIVVIGGMVYGTLMTLVVVPCIYDMFTRKDKKVKETAKEDGLEEIEISSETPSFATEGKVVNKTVSSNPYNDIVANCKKI